MIIKHGVDIVHIHRVKLLYEKFSDRFVNRIFTNEEVKYCFSSSLRSYARMAMRYAAKEAFVKALGCGIGPISFLDLEVVSLQGAPHMNLNNNVEKYIKMYYGNYNISSSLSLSDDTGFAVASVIVFMQVN